MSAEPCRHSAVAAPPPIEVEAALARARTRSLEQGQRWTEPRRRVYELLLQAAGPVKAYDLMDTYADAKPAKPPTVYRALEFLEQAGLVHRIPSLNAFIACGEAQAEHTAAFLICECCGAAQEFEPGRVAGASRAAAEHGFRVRALGLEVRGRCGRCA